MSLWVRIKDNSIRIANRHQTKIRFLLAGALNTTIGLAAYPLLYLFSAPLKLHYLFILVISQIFCVSFSFFTNKYMVFRTSGNHFNELAKFLTIHIFYFIINLAVLPALVELAGLNPMLAQTLFAGFIIVTSYFWHSRITFTSFKAPL